MDYDNKEELSRIVEETMPPSNPALVVGSEAEEVSRYLIEALGNPVGSDPFREWGVRITFTLLIIVGYGYFAYRYFLDDGDNGER